MPSDATPNDSELVALATVGNSLLRAGVPVGQIARALNVSEATVVTWEMSTTLVAEDQVIASLMRDLAVDAYWQAKETLMFGSPNERAALTKIIVGRSLGLLGAERSTQLESLRSEFETLTGMSGGGDELDDDDMEYDDAETTTTD